MFNTTKALKDMYSLIKNNFEDIDLKNFYNKYKNSMSENAKRIELLTKKINDDINENFISTVKDNNKKLVLFFNEIGEKSKLKYEQLSKYMAIVFALENIKDKEIYRKTNTNVNNFINEIKKNKKNINDKYIVKYFLNKNFKSIFLKFLPSFLRRESFNFLENKGWQPPYVPKMDDSNTDKIIKSILFIVWLIFAIIKGMVFILVTILL